MNSSLCVLALVVDVAVAAIQMGFDDKKIG